MVFFGCYRVDNIFDGIFFLLVSNFGIVMVSRLNSI